MVSWLLGGLRALSRRKRLVFRRRYDGSRQLETECHFADRFYHSRVGMEGGGEGVWSFLLLICSN